MVRTQVLARIKGKRKCTKSRAVLATYKILRDRQLPAACSKTKTGASAGCGSACWERPEKTGNRSKSKYVFYAAYILPNKGCDVMSEDAAMALM